MTPRHMKTSSLVGPIGTLAVGLTVAVGVGTFLHLHQTVRVFDQQLLTAGVSNVIKGSPPTGLGLTNATDVGCPMGVPVKAGTTFHCNAHIAGSEKSFAVVVIGDDETSATGGPASGAYTVAL